MVDGGWYGIRYANPYRPRSLEGLDHAWPRTLEELDIFWLEDFLHPENITGYAEIARSVTQLRIAAGEQLAGYEEFEPPGERRCRCMSCSRTFRCGGLTVGRQIAELAQRRADRVRSPCLADGFAESSLTPSECLSDEFAVPGIQCVLGVAIEPSLPESDPPGRRTYPGSRWARAWAWRWTKKSLRNTGYFE